MTDIAIRVENLGKEYKLGSHKSGDLRESFTRLFQCNPGSVSGLRPPGSPEDFWALKDVSFEIKQGEAVGIIGRNGAGKSTLLKILSRITEPTKGRFEIFGRVSSLLEVGTGFHPELTGRENVYLNGTILGMRRVEVKAKFDEIVAFSGVEKFIDTPVKHYSSGMQVRLAFAVAAHLEPEILIIDEVLAVGDAEFQKKCLGKMEDVTQKGGRTVLFVSHDMNAIQRLCPHGILLKQGGIEKDGYSLDVIKFYQNYIGKLGQTYWEQNKQIDHPHFRSIKIALEGKQPYLHLKILFVVDSVNQHLSAFVAFDVINSRGTTIMQALPELNPFINYSKEEEMFECQVELNGLVPDNYVITAWMGSHNSHTFDLQKEVVGFEILDSPTIGRTFPHTSDHGAIVPVSRVKKLQTEKLYEG